MRTALKTLAWICAGAAGLTVLAALAVLVAGNTEAGRALIERITSRLSAGTVELSGLGGAFPARLTLRELKLADARGVWLSAARIEVAWAPLEMLRGRIAVDDLRAARIDIPRRPDYGAGGGGSAWIPHIDVAHFAIDRVEFGAPLAGIPASLAIAGGMQMRSLEDARAEAVARRLDGGAEYALHLRLDPRRLDGTLTVREPASGPLQNLLGLPGLGALTADLAIHGPRGAARVALTLRAGEASADAHGSLDLEKGAVDLEYSLQSPALSPRADLGWQHLSLQGRWRGTFEDPQAEGRLQADRLQIPGGVQIRALRADLEASGGAISVRGVIDGLRMPGPQAGLFEADPVKFAASLRPGADGWPLEVQATHRLLSVTARAVTRGRQSASLDVRVPDLAPFAALLGQDVRGGALLGIQIERRGSGVAGTLDAKIGIAGGTAPWVEAVGKSAVLSAAATLSDGQLTVERARLDGRSFSLTASASAQRPTPGGPGASGAGARAAPAQWRELKARWALRIADLGIVAPTLAGSLQASGTLRGAPGALAADAVIDGTLSIHGSAPGPLSAEIHVRGAPQAPSGSVRLQGILDGAPVELRASIERRGRAGLDARIQHGEWKSVHAEGELWTASSIADARGRMRLQIGRLADLDPLLGSSIQGSLDGAVTFVPQAGRTHAQFELDAEGLAAGGISGAVHVTGEGDTDSVAARLRAQSPDIGGAPADLSAEALVNLGLKELLVKRAAAELRGQSIRLLAPATISYGGGVRLGKLELGARNARLAISGTLWPSLDARASLERVDAELIDAFLPDAVSAGTLDGTASLKGSLTAPTGPLRIHARGIRFSSDQTVGLPAFDLAAGADLAGSDAALDVRLSAAGKSLFTASGRAPLTRKGAFDLTLNGTLDLGMANALFEARGLHAAGALTFDASLAGTLDAPQIRGSVKLVDGSFRDYVRGLNLTGITAEVDGSEGSLRIESFTAHAASGEIGLSGSVGVLQPGIPVDLKIRATKAQLLNSKIVTANVSADLAVTGKLRERLELGGAVHVNRALIGIPDSLPPDVAVLDVRRRGQRAPPAPVKPLEIGLDISVDAPREILVQGRGLDAELGGDLRIRGTAQAPQVSGGFSLLRGTFALAGTTLRFDKDNSRLSFDGAGLRKSNIDPTLDFNAQTTVQNVIVKLRIYGYADSPKFEFSSPNNPGLSQDEIMARLLFGEDAAQLSALQLAQVGAALATISGVGEGGANPLTKLQKSLGLDRLSVGANTVTTATGGTENSGAAIQAGRYITRRVYIEGRQSTTGTSQVQVDVDLTKHLKLQTRLGNGTAIQGTTPENDPGSSIGLSYQIEY